MNKTIVLTCVAALCGASSFGEEESELAIDAAKPAEEAVMRLFSALPSCRQVTLSAESDAKCEVRLPGGEWIVAEEGKHYPFGTAYRAGKGCSMTVSFGQTSYVKVADGSGFTTVMQKVGDRAMAKKRSITGIVGTVELHLADNTPKGAFTVLTDVFELKDPAGESKVTSEGLVNGSNRWKVRCVTGSLSLVGYRNLWSVPVMHAANEIGISVEIDRLSTFLRGLSGDYIVRLDQGKSIRTETDEEGKLKNVVEPAELKWQMSPHTQVVINRTVTEIGGRMSVHTMAFDAGGVMKSQRVFCEERPELNSGEQVVKEGPSAEELAKEAAAMTVTTAASDAETKSDDAGDKADDAETVPASNDEL